MEVKFQYISQGQTPQEHLQNITEVCKSGGQWIQLRLKDESIATYIHTAIEARNVCDQYGAVLIINDHVDVAKMALADGVHLGLKDMDIQKARDILGDGYIIGGTANTLEDCVRHIRSGVDYIGLGPYRYTETKKELSPVLGIGGYRTIISALKDQETKVPVIAIGGIEEEDVPKIIETGISGIAVSGMLTHQEDLEKKIMNIKTIVD